MANDMTKKLFELQPYGKAALRKMGDVPENFRLYLVELLEDRETFKVVGAEFRCAMSGPNKGRLVIKIRETDRVAYVSQSDMKAVSGRKGAT